MVKLAVPAFDVSENIVIPFNWLKKLLPLPLLVNLVKLPAVALLLKSICAKSDLPAGVTKFCMRPESLVTPAPLNVSIGKKLELAVIVKPLAPGAKVIPSTVVFAETEMVVVFERAKVAVSANPLGTVAGVQFVAVFQSPEVGLRSH